MRTFLVCTQAALALACAAISLRDDDAPVRASGSALALTFGGNPIACAQCWQDSSTSDCNRCTLYGGPGPAGTMAKCASSEFNDGYFTNPSYAGTQCARTSTPCSSTTLLLYNNGTCDAQPVAQVVGGCTGKNFMNGTTITVTGQSCTGITIQAVP